VRLPCAACALSRPHDPQRKPTNDSLPHWLQPIAAVFLLRPFPTMHHHPLPFDTKEKEKEIKAFRKAELFWRGLFARPLGAGLPAACMLSTPSVSSCTLGSPPCFTGWAFFPVRYHYKAQPILLLSSLAPLYKHLKPTTCMFTILCVRCPSAAQPEICILFHIAAVHTVMCAGRQSSGRVCVFVNATQSCLCNTYPARHPPGGG